MRRSRRPLPASRSNPVLRGAIRQLIDHRSLTASMLAGSLLLVATQPAPAFTLGELNVQSRLGQRLAATVPVHLDAGETLRDGCVLPAFAPSGAAGSGLAGVPGVAVSTPEADSQGNYDLQVSSPTALYEPMYALELRINCPGIPAVVRQFVLMLDLPGAVAAAGTASPAAAVAPVRLPASSRATAEPTEARSAAPARLSPTTTPIAAGSRYRVARGDTLSSIAARVHDRQASLWAFAGAIHAANPDAFIHDDANLIKLGSEIVIPAATAGATTPAAPQAAQPAASQAAQLASQPAAATTGTAPEELTAPPAEGPSTAGAATQSATPAVDITVPPTTAAAPRPAPAPATTPAAKPTAATGGQPVAAADAPDAAEPNPFLAAGAGIIFGLLVSVLLWLRNRLPARHRPATVQRDRVDPEPAAPAATGSFGTIPVAIDRGEEPGFTVSWSDDQADDPLAAEFANAPTEVFSHPGPGETDPGHLLDVHDTSSGHTAESATQANTDITSELDELFDGTDTTIQKRLDAEKLAEKQAMELAAARVAADNEATVAMDALEQAGDVFNPGSPEESLSGNTVDFLIGELRAADEAAGGGATVEQPRPVPGSQPAEQDTVDIHALAGGTGNDKKPGKTLLEALSLLERDYENELTASQVLDLSAMRDALGDDNDEPTQLRESQAKDRRRKAR